MTGCKPNNTPFLPQAKPHNGIQRVRSEKPAPILRFILGRDVISMPGDKLRCRTLNWMKHASHIRFNHAEPRKGDLAQN